MGGPQPPDTLGMLVCEELVAIREYSKAWKKNFLVIGMLFECYEWWWKKEELDHRKENDKPM